MSGPQIVANINSLLAQKGISKKEFYEKCHITSASFSLWNKEKTKPRINNLAVIAEFLEVTLEDIIGEKEKSPAPEGVELDKATLELLEIWKSGDDSEREFLLANARMLKARRKNNE